MAAKSVVGLADIMNFDFGVKDTVEIQDEATGEVKVYKTANRAEVAAIVAYMLGIDEKSMENYYSGHLFGIMR